MIDIFTLSVNFHFITQSNFILLPTILVGKKVSPTAPRKLLGTDLLTKNYAYSLGLIWYSVQGCASGGGVEGRHTPKIVRFARSWSKVDHVAREFTIVFFLTFFITNKWSICETPPPPNGKCLGTSLVQCNSEELLRVVCKILNDTPFKRHGL